MSHTIPEFELLQCSLKQIRAIPTDIHQKGKT